MPFLLFIKIEIVTSNSSTWCRSKNWNECNKGNNGTNFNYCLFDSKLIGTKKIFNFIFRRLNLIVKKSYTWTETFSNLTLFLANSKRFSEKWSICARVKIHWLVFMSASQEFKTSKEVVQLSFCLVLRALLANVIIIQGIEKFGSAWIVNWAAEAKSWVIFQYLSHSLVYSSTQLG